MTFVAGRLLCGPIREYLKKAKFKGYDIDFHESRGWFEREFIVKGDLEHLKIVKADIDRYVEEVNRE
jgi:hypothetical protein